MAYPPTNLAPWDNQIAAWDKAQGLLHFYLAMDMGTGKSKSAIDFCNGWDARRVLVLCPKKVIDVWPKQFAIHSYHEFEVVAITKTMPVKKKAALFKERLELAAIKDTRLAIVINYDAFWMPPLGPVYNDKNRIVALGLLNKYKWDVMICDEAHRLMSPGGRAAWGATKLARAQAKHRLMLSGTPMPSSPLNIYSQFRVMDDSIYGTSFMAFKTRYAMLGGYQNKQVLGYINEEELSAKFHSNAYQCKKNEVLDLPPVMHEYRYCDLGAKATKVYTDLAKNFEAEVIHAKLGGGGMSVQNALVKILRLCQITGGYFKLDDGRELTMDNSKLEVAQEIIEDLDPQEPVVIFCRFQNEIKRLREMVEKKCKRTVGEMSGAANDLAAWQEGDLNTLVVQIQAGGEGVDFTRSCYCIYFSLGYVSPGQYQQSLARTDRPGQTRPVTYYHILANGTIDHAVYASHKKKIDTVEMILDMVQNGKSHSSSFELNAA